ncbi:spindle poison sensitivity protein [Grosmannia clavigera kw1407]|uniref:Spindle poison sensitivity protein n=1 Tax=Grosmannia clavigera (strain kw1407 / UAMH 11150) TaxID=655863 RepID=F0XF72_GROCL|nr:spindle poison sensitivity protein [Grosmannia clavigera kw1407]EFX03469.1 spindle poison sensitivity protein [Grosmannia clavigera kw1407]
MPASNLPDFRHTRSASLTKISPPNGHHLQDPLSPMATQRFDGPRSPPNTAHVPCKFFRQGACQAGNSCPFSHDIGAATETVCKYFAKVTYVLSARLAEFWQRPPLDTPFPTPNCSLYLSPPKVLLRAVFPSYKAVDGGGTALFLSFHSSSAAWHITDTRLWPQGNCKFGPKCANIHVLPDGRRVNYGKNGVTIGAAPLGLGNRINPAAYLQSSNSALTNSFLHANAGTAQSSYPANPPFSTGAAGEDRFHSQSNPLGRQPSMDGGLPTIDTTYPSNPASAYGSPPGAGLAGLEDPRAGLGLSPVNVKVLSVLDAPLPASFDSNGISHAARYGPWPASVPSKFGLESPTPSLHNAKDDRTSETLKLLHTSAFGSSDHLSAGLLPPDHSMGSSPTALGAHEEFFGKRAMHSSSLRYSKPRLLSSSVPKVDRDWDNEFLFLEEDYVPGTLANEVLTPQEKARRGSLRLNDGDGLSETPVTSNPASANATKFGSPVGAAAASPSRWSPWFQQRQPPRSDDEPESGSLSRSMKHAASAFGHVGSPLRNSSLASNGDLDGHNSDFFSRSISQSATVNGSESLSVLTQQLQRTRLSDDGSSAHSLRLHPNAARNPSVSLNTIAAAGIIGRDRSDRDRGFERHVSSGSIGSSAAGRFPTIIDEEDPAFLFSMEEEDEAASQVRTPKRKSVGLVSGNGAAGSSLWSYAGIVSGKDAAKTHDSSNPVESIGGR